MFFTSSILQKQPCIHHGFFTRQGGKSTGVYTSLNCGMGSDDNPETVAENRATVAGKLDILPEKLITLYQIHSNKVVVIDDSITPQKGREIQADAMVSTTPGIGLGILTADCCPILFCDPTSKTIGAAHAGWKGALGKIFNATLDQMEILGARRENILAAIGPTIQQQSYEVGIEIHQSFTDENPDFAAFFQNSGRENHFLFDLPGLIYRELTNAKLAHVDWLKQDTYQQPDVFYSYRRATHQKEPDYARQISAICLTS